MPDPWDNPSYDLLQAYWNEPDVWHSCAYGYYVHAQRNLSKAWCGYVGIPPSHPLYGKSYNHRVPVPSRDEVYIGHASPIAILLEAVRGDDNEVSLELLLQCPGGLTWSDNRLPGAHRDGLWWFGFDCSHYNDLTPKGVFNALAANNEYPWSLDWRADGTAYRDLAYVKYSVTALARQLSEF